MALGEEKICAHCGKDLATLMRHIINTDFDFPGAGERRAATEGSWVNLCNSCYTKRKELHRKVDREYLKLDRTNR